MSAGRRLRIRQVLLLAVLLSSTFSTAFAQDTVPYNKVFFETFMTRCMPAAHAGFEYNTEGMTRVEERLAKHWLNGGAGSVWSPQLPLKILFIARGDGSCQVVSASGDARAMQATVAKWFDDAPSPFKRDRFERTPDGGFEAMYYRDCADGLRCRVIINARGVPEKGQLAMMAMAGRVRP